MLRQHKFAVVALAILALGLLVAVPSWGKEVKGKIKSVDGDNAKIVVTSNDKDLTMTVKDDCKITLNGEKAKLEDLKPNHLVTITCEEQGDGHACQEIAAKEAESD